MTDAELASLLADAAKWIDGDIVWVDDEDHSLAVEFQVTVQSDAGYPLVVRARYNSTRFYLLLAMVTAMLAFVDGRGRRVWGVIWGEGQGRSPRGVRPRGRRDS